MPRQEASSLARKGMRRHGRPGAVLAALCLASAAAHAADSPESSAAGGKSLDEIMVQGTTLAALRTGMARLEDEFYRRYNELNSNDLYDVYCAVEARTGTRLERRYCRPVFEIRALQTEGSEHWYALERATDKFFPQAWNAPLPALLTTETMKRDLQEEIRRVTEANPELVDLLRRRAELAERYEKMRRERFSR